MIRMIVTPSPVFALLGRRQFAKFPIRPVRFHDPLAVIADFVVVPDVIIVIERIVNANCVVFGATSQYDR
jgi:hypothetical protein